jgi:hypothetical protein
MYALPPAPPMPPLLPLLPSGRWRVLQGSHLAPSEPLGKRTGIHLPHKQPANRAAPCRPRRGRPPSAPVPPCHSALEDLGARRQACARRSRHAWLGLEFGLGYEFGLGLGLRYGYGFGFGFGFGFGYGFGNGFGFGFGFGWVRVRVWVRRCVACPRSSRPAWSRRRGARGHSSCTPGRWSTCTGPTRRARCPPG